MPTIQSGDLPLRKNIDTQIDSEWTTEKQFQELTYSAFQKYVFGRMAASDRSIDFLMEKVSESDSFKVAREASLSEKFNDVNQQFDKVRTEMTDITVQFGEYYKIFNFLNQLRSEVDVLQDRFDSYSTSVDDIVSTNKELKINTAHLLAISQELQDRSTLVEERLTLAENRLNILTSTTLFLRAVWRRVKLRTGFTK